MVWRDGIVPDGGPSFPATLTGDLLDFGYVVLALALELRDANASREPELRFRTDHAFEVAAEALESAARRGDSIDGDHGRHLVIAAAAFHLAGYAARSYSLLPLDVLQRNLASCERALAFLLRRDLLALRGLVVNWLADDQHSDSAVERRLMDEEDLFDADDASILALNAIYFRALGLADTALVRGDGERCARAIAALHELVGVAARIGNIPMWWVATLTAHLFRDLWEQCLHTQLPKGPRDDLPVRWDQLRHDFITQLAVRVPPHIDLWPSQLEAARRSTDPKDDLVIALPTSAGKTRIAELCILRTLAEQRRVVYVTPLRALSAQVERVLACSFVPLGAAVTSLYGAIGSSSVDDRTLVDADIVVATPEKLDFALRQDPNVLDDVGLVVLDEGHMIGLGSREIRYEVLIQRLLRRQDAAERRIVCLSAMFNPKDKMFKDFGAWLRSDAPGDAVHVEWRPTRQRLAHLDWNAHFAAARLSFLEGEEAFVLRFIEQQPPRKQRKKAFPASEIEFCIAAANAFARDGHNVLVYSPQRSQIDPLVREFLHMKKQGYLTDLKVPDLAELATALAIGREWLGKKHPAVQALQIGVGTHHGALPRPFQSAVEALLNRKRLPVVVASPTLAQGVDLSCSVLLFRSLTRFDAQTGKQKPISAAEFANVVGRAGRAYVDLDGIVALPSFEAGWARDHRHEQFEALIEKSRSQRLFSGIMHLVFELAGRIGAKLGVEHSNLLDYVLSNDVWSDGRLALPEAIDEEDDETTRSFEQHVADLDVAILSLVDPLDAPTEQLAELLDDILKDSLWKRTLEHATEELRSLERALLVSRSQWLWAHTTVEQRRACFSAGLGARPGTFLYDHLDELVELLVDLQAAITQGDRAKSAATVVKFAEFVTADPFFAVRKPPDAWPDVLTRWVAGVAFSEVLDGLGARDEQRTQAFVQDGIVFRLVWAAEAVRVQAVSAGHARAEWLGDGPMLVLTHGVPSVSAALLCQAGYASRAGAEWLASKLLASFTDLDGMQRWITANEDSLSDPDFWESEDQRLLWREMSTPTQRERPQRWKRRKVVVSPRWISSAPPLGVFVRLISDGAQMAMICSENLEPLGSVALPFDPEGAALTCEVQQGGGLGIFYFGPN